MNDAWAVVTVVGIVFGLPSLALLSIPWVMYLTERKRR